MIVKWFKKKLLMFVIKDILKDLPSFKNEILKIVEIEADEFLEKCEDEIKKFAKEFFVSKITNHSKD